MTDIQPTAQPLAKTGQTASLGGPAGAADSAGFEGLFAVLEMIGAEAASQPELAARLAAAMGEAEKTPSAELASIEGPAAAGSLDTALAGSQNGEGQKPGEPAMGLRLPDALLAKTASPSGHAAAQIAPAEPDAALPRLSADILGRFSWDDLAHLQHQARRLLKDGQQASPNMEALVALLDEKLARAARKKADAAMPQKSTLTENQTAPATPAGPNPQNSPAAQPALPEMGGQPASPAAPNLALNPLQAGTADGTAAGTAASPALAPLTGEQPSSQPASADTEANLARATQAVSGQSLSGQSLSGQSLSGGPYSGEGGKQPAGQKATQADATQMQANQKPAAKQAEAKSGQSAAEPSRLTQGLSAEPVPAPARPADPLAAGRPAGAHPVMSAATGKQQDSADLSGRKKRAAPADVPKTDRSGPSSQTLAAAGSTDRPGLDLAAGKPGSQVAEMPPALARMAQARMATAENTSPAETAIEGGGAEERPASRTAGSPSGQPAASAQGGAALQRLNMLAKGWQDNLVRQAEKALLEGRETVRLVLNPRHLGRLQLSLGLTGGEAHIQIQAESGAAAQLLGESEARLQQMLEAAGLRLASLNTGSGFGAGGRQSGNQQEAENSSGPPARADAEKNLTENLDKTDKEFLNILA